MSVPWEERPQKGEEVVPLAWQESTVAWAKGERSLFCWYLLGVFPLSSVGLVIKKENERYVSCRSERGACHPDWKAAWMAYFYLLLRLAQPVPLAVQHSWWTARYLQPPAAPSVLTQSSLLKLLSEESAQFRDFTSPGYCWNPTVTLF